MSALNLTPDELHDLTDTPVAALQAAWLTENRWTYVISRKGKPKVARAYYEMRMGVRVAANDEQGQTEPDWSRSA